MVILNKILPLVLFLSLAGCSGLFGPRGTDGTVPADTGETFTATKAQEGLGVYVYDRNPSGVDFFSQWTGLELKYAEDFIETWGWGAYTDPNSRAGHWSAWKAAKPGRRLILTVAPFPSGDIPGSWGGAQADTAEARDRYQKAAAGDFDTYYENFGKMLKNLGLGDAILRFGHEMNGDWYAWSIVVPKDGESFNQANETIRQEKQTNYAAAFRRFAGALRGIEGTDFEFCWNPSTTWDTGHRELLGNRAYPGDDYVDYIAFDQYDHYFNAYRDTPGYHSSTNEAFRRGVQQQAWNAMVNQGAGMNWFAAFAQEHGKPLAIAEWGLWLEANVDGGDNPYFIEKMYEWINANNVAWHVYFMFGDVSHSLYNTVKYPIASQKFQELWNPKHSPQVQPAILPSAISGYNGEVKRGRDAVFGGGNVSLTSDPWAYSDGMLAGMWTHKDSWTNATTVTFTNCPASSGFALVYQLWHTNLSNSDWDNNQRVSLYVDGSQVKSAINLSHGGRGWGDSYMIMRFDDVTIPAGANVMFRADQNTNTAWTSLNFDYLVFR